MKGTVNIRPPKMGRPFLIDEVRAKELWDQGLTDAEIAEQLGMHKNTVFLWRKRNGIGISKKEGI